MRMKELSLETNLSGNSRQREDPYSPDRVTTSRISNHAQPVSSLIRMMKYSGVRTLVVIALGSFMVIPLFYNIGKVNQAALSAEKGTITELYTRGSSEADDTEGISLRPNGPHGRGMRDRPDPTQLRFNTSTTIGDRENRLADEALDGSKMQWGNESRYDGINNTVNTSTNIFGRESQPVDRCSEEFRRFGGSSQISARDIGCEGSEDRAFAIFDLRNVAVQGDVLHVYAPGAETRDKLEQWNNRLPALTYKWGGIAEDGKQIEIHDEPLHESICHTRSHGVSFYLAPHFQENAFHLHNDNIMPMTSSILSTPCLCSGAELESCTQLQKNLIQTPRKKQKHGYTHPEFLEIFGSMFDYQSKLDRGIHGTRLAPTKETSWLHCLDHMVWGYPKPYYVNCAAARASAALAWQHFMLQKLGIRAPASMTPVQSSPAKDAKPRVLFLRRTAVQSGPEKTRRFMPDRSSLQRAWMDVGIHMKEWIYAPNANLKSIIGSLAGFDIYIGVHGAQLTNILYGTPGLVLVEVQNAICVKDMFRQVANSMNGGYVRVNTKYSSHFQLNDDAAAAAVRCALALWRRNDTAICEDAMSTGSSQCPQTGPGRHGKDIEGIVYYEEVGQLKC